jgi:cell division protein FtsL
VTRASRPPLLGITALLMAALLSALAVIASSHRCRELYATLQSVEAQQWYLQEEFGRLLLERSTWAAPRRVESVADAALGMMPPELDRLRLVSP